MWKYWSCKSSNISCLVGDGFEWPFGWSRSLQTYIKKKIYIYDMDYIIFKSFYGRLDINKWAMNTRVSINGRNKSCKEVCNCIKYVTFHSMARGDLNQSKKVLTTASKDMPKRPRICIYWNPRFQTDIYLVIVPLDVIIVKQDLLKKVFLKILWSKVWKGGF